MAAQLSRMTPELHRVLANALLDENFSIPQASLANAERDLLELDALHIAPGVVVSRFAQYVYGPDYMNVIYQRIPQGIHAIGDRMQPPLTLSQRANLWLAIQNSLDSRALNNPNLSATLGVVSLKDTSGPEIERAVQTLASTLGGNVKIPTIFAEKPAAWFALQSVIPVPPSEFDDENLMEHQRSGLQKALQKNEPVTRKTADDIWNALYLAERSANYYATKATLNVSDEGRAFASFSDSDTASKSKTPWIVAGAAVGVCALIYLAMRRPKRQPV